MTDDANRPSQLDELDRLATMPIDDADVQALDVLP